MKRAQVFAFLLVLAACGSDRTTPRPDAIRSGTGSTLAATGSPAMPGASGTTSATVRPLATRQATPAASASPSPFAGRSQSVPDTTGDVVGEGGTPPSRAVPGTDLTAVEIRDDGNGLLITFTVAGQMPRRIDGEADYDEIAFHVVGRESPDRFAIEMSRAELVATVYDASAGASRSYAGRVTIRENQIAVKFFYPELPVRYARPFGWRAQTEYASGGRSYYDYVPGNGDDYARFPA